MRKPFAGLFYVALTLMLSTSLCIAATTEEHHALKSWQAAPNLPIAMQEIYPAVFLDRIFVGGGFTPSESGGFYGLGPTNRIYLLNPAENAWQRGPDIPSPRHHLGMVSNIHYVYAIGGFTGSKKDIWQPQKTVYRLDGRKKRWSSAASLPIPLAESSYANVGKNIHVIGGKTRTRGSTENDDTNAHYVLVNNAYWRKAPVAPTARSSAASAVVDDKIYIIGGRTGGDDSQNLNIVEMYDTQSKTWQSLSPLPISAAGLAASVIDGKIIVSGGEALSNKSNWQAGEVFDSVFQYDPSTDEWQMLSALPAPRHGHGTVSLNDMIYIIGGAAKVGPQETLTSVVSTSK